MARQWSGQDVRPRDDNGALYWDDRTRYEVEGYAWRDAPPPATIKVRNALIPLGGARGLSYFAFVAPLVELTDAFASSARALLASKDSQESLESFDLSVDLRKIVARQLAPDWILHSVSCELSDGSYVVMQLGNHSSFPRSIARLDSGVARLDAVEFLHEGKITKVNNGFTIEVSDVSSEDNEVFNSLSRTFQMLRPFVRLSSSRSEVAHLR